MNTNLSIIAKVIPAEQQSRYLVKTFGPLHRSILSIVSQTFAANVMSDEALEPLTFIHLSNGTGYLRPGNGKMPVRLTIPSSHYSRSMSSDAAGMILTLRALSTMGYSGVPVFGLATISAAFQNLSNYAVNHAEWDDIYDAID